MNDVTLAILAGGGGTRMGMPKSSLIVRGQPVLEYLVQRFDWPGPTMLITAPGFEHPVGTRLFDCEATDPVAGEGPLRGVLTALKHCPSKVAVITTVDMPNVQRSQLQWLAGELNDLRGHCTRSEAQIEPFPAALRIDAIPDIERLLAQNVRSVKRLMQKDGFLVTPAPKDWPDDTWLNLNTPEELDRFNRER